MEVRWNEGGAAVKVPIVPLAKVPGRVTPEQRYWKSFKFPIITKYGASINTITFQPAEPNNYLVGSGSSVYVYDYSTNEVKNTISLFKKAVRCASYRDDGQLLAVGGDDMKIDIINSANRSILRQAKGHTGPINDIQFIPNKSELVSCSDDKTIKLWDIATESAISTFHFHEDYVRAIRFHPQSNLLVAGSYDHSISLWDLRSNNTTSPISSFKHSHPVESLEFFPTSTSVACAEGNGVSIWDIVSGKIITRLANHQKTVTKICFEGSGNWFASSSLDHQVKVYDLNNYQVVNSFKYTAPILSFAISKNNSHLVVGMSDGTLSIRRRRAEKSPEEQETGSKSKKLHEDDDEPKPYTFNQYRHRGSKAKPSESDFQVSFPSKVRYQEYERHLRKFLYREALDSVLKTRDPSLVLTVIQELLIQNALVNSLSNRDSSELEAILKFVHKNILNPRYNENLFLVLDTIIDLYAHVLGKSPRVDELVNEIHSKLNQEIESQKQMLQLIGGLELIISTKSLFSR